MKIRTAIATAASVLCAAGMAHAQSYVESFDDILQLPANGWFEQNNSVPGLTNYFQGNAVVFAAQATTGYLGTNFNNTSGLNTISNWMVTPTRTLENGQSFAFWTRTVDAPAFPDRLQVRMSLNGASTNVGTAALDVGDFSTLLLDINPTYTTAGYPNTWTRYEIILSGIAAPTSGRLAFRYFVENGGPSGANSDYIGIDEVVYTAGAVVTGACCLPNGSCSITSSVVCASQSGIYRGDNTVCATANCPQPITGACCLPAGCSLLTAAQCLAQNGTYRGDNTVCATANCPITEYVEVNDAGDLPGTAAVAAGNGPLLSIRGNLAGNDADMYRINICSPGSFSATTVGGSTVDTQLFLFAANGTGIAHDDDDPNTGVLQSTLSSLFTASLPAGEYLLAVSAYDMDPLDTNLADLWLDTPFNAERAPDGPGAANPVAGWFASGGAGAYTIALQGSCFVSTGPACYANCDGSSVAPILNVSDFICFQTKYAAGDSYANCDGSTTPPVLNVSDFICFQTKYAAGCS